MNFREHRYFPEPETRSVLSASPIGRLWRYAGPMRFITLFGFLLALGLWLPPMHYYPEGTRWFFLGVSVCGALLTVCRILEDGPADKTRGEWQ